MAYAAIADVKPGGHFFATEHTMERFDTAFYSPLVADLQNYGSWEESGSQNAETRATKIWQDTLSSYVVPKGCEEISGRLEETLAKLTEAGGAYPTTD